MYSMNSFNDVEKQLNLSNSGYPDYEEGEM
jgi:hypothetical protein